MRKSFLSIVNTNVYLKTLSHKDRESLPYEKLASRLKNVQNHSFLSKIKKNQTSADKTDKADFFVTEKDIPDKIKCAKLADIISNELKLSCSAQTIRDFWQRVYRTKYGITGHSSLETVLDPLSRLCGYKDFEDFVTKEFVVENKKFKVLILPFSGDFLDTNDAEIILNKRYEELCEKEKLPMEILFDTKVSDTFFTHEKARKAGKARNADLVVFGDLFLRNPGNERIRLQYVLTESNKLFDFEKWSSFIRPFKFYELSNGSLPLNIDYVIYWSLGMKAYQYNKGSEALKFFSKIEDDLNIGDEEVYFRMAVLYDLDQQDEKALKYYSKVLQIDGVHYNTFFNLGTYHLLKGDHLKAKYYLSHLINNIDKEKVSESLFEMARINLSVSLHQLGEIELAKQYLKEAEHYIKQQPSVKEYTEFLAKIYIELGEICENHEKPDDCAKAKEYFLEALRLSTEPATHTGISYFFRKNKLSEEALLEAKKYHGNKFKIIHEYNKQPQKDK